MVQRVSEALNINTGSAPTAQMSGMGMKRPDVQLESPDHARAEAPDLSTERVLSSIMGVVGEFGKKVFKASTEEAYLEGVAKAGTIQNENELQTNPITADWTTAGYRDTMGRLRSADLDAQRVTDMARMREKTPEEFKDYITKQRQELLPQLEGMSRAQRQSMLAQTMLSERSAIKLHGSEHAKYIWEVQEKGIKSGALSAFQVLDAAKSGTPEAYEYETQAAHGKIFSSIIQNPRITDTQRASALMDVATAALERNHQGLFQQILKSEVPMLDGTVRPMRSLLSFDQESKLHKEYEASLGRTAGMRLQKWVDDTAKLEAEWRNPDSAAFPTLDQVREVAAQGVQNGYFKTPQEQNNFMQSYYEHARKRDDESGAAAAYANGDQQWFTSKGKTREEGLKAHVKQLSKTMALPDVATSLIANGVKTGQSESFKAVGSLLAPMVAQLGSVKEVNKENAQTVWNVLRQIDKLEGEQQTAALHHFMSGIPEGQQTIISRVREAMRNGEGAEGAVSNAMQAEVDANKLDPQTRKAMMQEASTADAKEIAAIQPESWLGHPWRSIKAMLGNENAINADKLQAPESVLPWKDASAGAINASYRARLEVGEAVKRIRLTSPELSSTSVVAQARADVANRTVPTANGPLILPHGSNLSQTFGTGTADQERLGMAVDALYKAPENGSVSFSIDPQGRLKADFWTEAGLRAKPSEFVDTKAVGAKVKEQRDDANRKFKYEKGEGKTMDGTGLDLSDVDPKTVKGSGVASITFNGDNTAGIPNTTMFALRERLVKHEGVKDKPYKDMSGKMHKGQPVMTVGAGISTTNDFFPPVQPDGTVRKEDIDNSFKLASNQAAQFGLKASQVTGIKGENALLLFSELAYQSGIGGLQNKAFGQMVKAIQAKDAAAARAALEQHPVWQYNGMNTARGRHYADLVTKLATPQG